MGVYWEADCTPGVTSIREQDFADSWTRENRIVADAAPGPTCAETNSQTTAMPGPVWGREWDSWDGELRWTDTGGRIWDMKQQRVVAEKECLLMAVQG